MKILVTGASGFLGRNLVHRLILSGHQVFALVSRGSANRLSIANHDSVTIIEADLTDFDTKILPVEIDTLVTLAQSSHFREFPEHALDVFQVNVAANLKLWDWARKTGVQRVIHVSSGGIYGPSAANNLLEEDAPVHIDSPIGFYLGTKLCCEIILNNYKDFFKCCVILRPFFIYGPGQKKDMLIARLIESIKNDRPIILHGNNGLKINPIFIDDAVEGLVNALSLDGYHVINMAGPNIMDLKEIAQQIANKLNRRPVYHISADPAPDYATATEKCLRLLKIPTVRFEEGIEKTLAACITCTL